MSENWLRYYLGPTGIPDKLNALARLVPMVADGQDYVDYYQAGGRTMNALGDRNLWGTVEGIGDMASAGAAMMLPGVTARAINESVDVAGDLGRFVADESGALRLGDDIEARGAQIMDMLRSGRGSEVTDQMLDLGDPVQNARLNEYLFNNYDLPMDTASRMDRAQGMGFDTATPLYHGTTRDFHGFDLNQVGTSNDEGFYGRGVYSTPNARLASDYAWDSSPRRGGSVIPVMTAGETLPLNQSSVHSQRVTENIYNGLPGSPPQLPLSIADAPQLESFAKGAGRAGVDVRVDSLDPYGLDVSAPIHERVTFDPANIRSRFARFDPRLSHLRNLSAAGAGVAMLPREEDRNSDAAQIRAYLQSIGLE